MTSSPTARSATGIMVVKSMLAATATAAKNTAASVKLLFGSICSSILMAKVFAMYLLAQLSAALGAFERLKSRSRSDVVVSSGLIRAYNTQCRDFVVR